MLPWFWMPPAMAPASKFSLPARKLLLEMASVEATSPCTSILAEGPNRMPFGFTSHTRPLDCSAPRIAEASAPVTRFRTLLVGPCWMKRAASLAPIENPRQLMMVPGVLVTVSAPVCCENAALPTTTCGPAGNAKAAGAAKHAATATLTRRGFSRETASTPGRVFIAQSKVGAATFLYYSPAVRRDVNHFTSVNMSHLAPPADRGDQNDSPTRACSFHAPRLRLVPGSTTWA